MLNKMLLLLLISFLYISITPSVHAAGVQGKSSLETNRSSSKENKNVRKKVDGGKPSKTQTQVAKSLDRNSVGKQRQTTRSSIKRLLNKK